MNRVMVYQRKQGILSIVLEIDSVKEGTIHNALLPATRLVLLAA